MMSLLRVSMFTFITNLHFYNYFHSTAAIDTAF